jgi:hypothetical protein
VSKVVRATSSALVKIPKELEFFLILQLPFPQVSESMGNHDSKIVDAAGVD